MKAELLMDDRYELDERSFAELVVWRRADGSIKYRLAFVVDDDCVLRYDNETGKGDRRHIGRTRRPISSRRSTNCSWTFGTT